ncbi:hypothetical protein [Wolbachia endosymbiont of Brugia pahangi]|uniref:hypothetical protein n=1 Tax=Wolbachia endosymbiont of Brugia pahangi TaxID=96495 RepID=UPI00143AE5DB|nr:hypothetical protein [Wolbachia endosymbiont of Brugia pahangi]
MNKKLPFLKVENADLLNISEIVQSSHNKGLNKFEEQRRECTRISSIYYTQCNSNSDRTRSH